MTVQEIKQSLINAGIKNLKEFGYPDVNAENIINDEVYSKFFLSMLKENLGYGVKINTAIKELINQIEEKHGKG